MRRRLLVLVTGLALATGSIAWAQAAAVATLTAAEAKDHVGERATVCGKVVDSRYASSSRGKPTFLNLDRPYPRQVFTAVIWGEDRAKFDEPEETYRDKKICVTGKITSYRDVPQIAVSEPEQITTKQGT